MAERFSLRGGGDEPAARTQRDKAAPQSEKPPVEKRRRSENRQRTAQVKVRWTPEEKAQLEANAQAAGLDVAAFVRLRTIGTKGPRTQGRRMTPDIAELARVRAEIGRVGNNLNQLTRLANMGDLDRPAELDRTLAVEAELMDKLRYLLRGEE